MSDSSGRDANGGSKRGLSRRDVLLGRLLQLNDDAGELPGSPNNQTRTSRTVMRYPKSLADVEVADAAAVQLPDAAARRRMIPVFRPPGAIDEPSFLAGCTRCEACVEACPHDAIVHAPARLREVAGTPVIEADHQPCLMCADFPCIASCEPGVLRADLPKMMGTAHITAHLCVAHHGTPCTTCSEECPVERAIVQRNGKPVVDESRCTGCGVCRAVCPAPENAVLLMPTFLRPSRPSIGTPRP